MCKPEQVIVIVAYQEIKRPGNNEMNKTMEYQILNTMMGSEDQKEKIEVTFWNTYVWTFKKLNLKVYDQIILREVDLVKCLLNDKNNQGTIEFVGHMNDMSEKSVEKVNSSLNLMNLKFEQISSI